MSSLNDDLSKGIYAAAISFAVAAIASSIVEEHISDSLALYIVTTIVLALIGAVLLYILIWKNYRKIGLGWAVGYLIGIAFLDMGDQWAIILNIVLMAFVYFLRWRQTRF